MRKEHHIVVIIPALNEAETIGQVLEALPEWVDLSIVADNGSTDSTSSIAFGHGARVVYESQRGYGAACLRGMREIPSLDVSDDRVVVVFLDGDLSDNPGEMALLVDPIVLGECEFVVGSRILGDCEKGALSFAQRFGSRLSSLLIRALYGVRHTDLGPFRAVRWDALKAMSMDDLNFGWTVQMQVRAAKLGLRMREVAVSYRNRAGGKSKVSGTLSGSVKAGTIILKVIFYELMKNTQPQRDKKVSSC